MSTKITLFENRQSMEKKIEYQFSLFKNYCIKHIFIFKTTHPIMKTQSN
jgi:hypothetical protein